jgi:tetratricopeptide (TPR) repeat protein
VGYALYAVLIWWHRRLIFLLPLSSNIGSVLMVQRHHEESLKMHHWALEIQKALPKDEQKNMATTYANLAQAWHGRGDFDKALKMYKRATLISEKLYGTDHQATAPIYSSIGSFLLLQGKHSRALDFFQQALKVFKAKPGENHPDTAKPTATLDDFITGRAVQLCRCTRLAWGDHVHTVRRIAFLRWKTSIFARVFLAHSSFVSMSASFSSFVSMLGACLGHCVGHKLPFNKAKSLQAKGDYVAALTAYKKLGKY